MLLMRQASRVNCLEVNREDRSRQTTGVQLHLQQLKDAERALVGALEADPSCSKTVELQGAWRLRGEVRARLGHRRDAVADLERCVELDPYSNDGRMCQTLLEDAR